jgi:hypothetical protein
MMIVQQLRSIDSYARWDHFNKQVASRNSQVKIKIIRNQKYKVVKKLKFTTTNTYFNATIFDIWSHCIGVVWDVSSSIMVRGTQHQQQ